MGSQDRKDRRSEWIARVIDLLRGMDETGPGRCRKGADPDGLGWRETEAEYQEAQRKWLDGNKRGGSGNESGRAD
jgi:hypothetical protein